MFWKQLFLDYRDVAVDVCKEFKERPVKSCFYVTSKLLHQKNVFLQKKSEQTNNLTNNIKILTS